MAFVILGDLFSFPEGDSSTNRVHSYSKGLLENGENVHVVCFGNEYTEFGNGEVNGVYYYHPFGQKIKSKYFIVRTLKKIRKFIRTFTLLLRINRKDKIRAIVVYTLLPATFMLSWLLSRLTGSELIQEMSEHPLRRFQGSTLKRLLGNFKIKSEILLSDGIFVISYYLKDFYVKRGMLSERLLIVPTTVDPGRFSKNGSTPYPYTYIGYFGGLTFYRDNVDLLIEAFALVSSRFSGLQLVLGGFCTDTERKQIEDLISELGISERVNLLKYLPREEIIRYIINSHILVMVRANDEKTQATFPSKLAEYLAASKPVISVNVGEISQYLTDGVDAYVVEPGNKKDLAEKIAHILNDYESAMKVARQGRHLADTVFNYNYQAKRIIPFVKSLKKI